MHLKSDNKHFFVTTCYSFIQNEIGNLVIMYGINDFPDTTPHQTPLDTASEL